MAEAQDARERRVKWLRRAARVFGVVSASCWALLAVLGSWLAVVLCSLGTGGYFDPEMQQRAVRVCTAIVVAGLALAVAPLVGVGIAFRWERVGGAVLVASGLLLLIPVALFVRGPLRGSDWILLLIPVLSGLLSMAAGVLFLASWRKSRTLQAPQPTE